jgi:Ca2+-binding RTX toxin-like protein
MADIDGTPGDDGLIGTSGDDTINGFAGNDVERGRSGSDTLNGGDDHDFLVGGDGNDTLNGGTGDDYLRGGEGDDAINGGDGFDRAAFTVLVNDPSIGETGVQTGATVDLNIVGVAQNTGHGMDTLTGIENVSGTAYADTLTGDGNNNWIWGEGGDDTLSGGGGNDLVEVDAGNSTLDGGLGNDTAGFAGQDSFTSGVDVSLALQGSAQTVATGSSMTLTNFENLTGTVHDDTLAGDGGDNVLAGSAGNDTLLGGGGADTLYGDGRIAADTHGTGFSGPVATVADASGEFDPEAFTFNDTLDGGAGDDILNGGGGSDTASFASATEGVFAGLGNSGNGSAENFSGTEFDQLISIENLSGSAFNDQLLGNDSANVLTGGDGHDLLFGRGGDDTMIGGNGDDFLRGSDGADILDGGSGWDRVSSFVVAPTAGISFDLNIQGVAQDTGQGMDTLIGIEHASGTTLNDTLTGNSGDNWLWDGSDGDHATVGTGDDVLSGGGGNDLIETGGGNDTLAGGLGTDTLSFFGGRVEISSAGVTYSLALQGAAQATEQGSMITTGFENVSGSVFDDVLTGNGGANILLGDHGNDILSGGDGDDTLYGDGRIQVDSHGTGGSGPITLFGNVDDESGFNVGDPDFTSGNDTLVGGKGNDTLYGGRGDDMLTGNQGGDTFVIETASGHDHVTDFGGADHIRFDGVAGVDDFSDLLLTRVGSDTVITWGTSDSLTVDGLRPNQLHASDFDFTGSALLATQDISQEAVGGKGYDLAAVSEALSLGSSIHSPMAAAAADPIDHAMATMAMQAHI